MRRSRTASPVADLGDHLRTFEPPLPFHEGMQEARRLITLAGSWSTITIPFSETVSLVPGHAIRIESMDWAAPISVSGLRALRRRIGFSRDALVLPEVRAVPPRGIVLREHSGTVRAAMSTSYRAIEDIAVLDVLAHHVERASLADRVFVAGITTGARTMLRLAAPVGATGLTSLADISNSHDGSQALFVRVRTFEPTAEGLVPEWRVAGRVVHRGEDLPGRVESMVMRAICVLAGVCRRS